MKIRKKSQMRVILPDISHGRRKSWHYIFHPHQMPMLNKINSTYVVGLHGIWATSTESSETSSFFRCIGYVPAQVSKGSFRKSYGLSVRCIRD
jgi:hypothetical protein